jgi:RsiW-degrading membrane proteinase PrsW (M82 family)
MTCTILKLTIGRGHTVFQRHWKFSTIRVWMLTLAWYANYYFQVSRFRPWNFVVCKTFLLLFLLAIYYTACIYRFLRKYYAI